MLNKILLYFVVLITFLDADNSFTENRTNFKLRRKHSETHAELVKRIVGGRDTKITDHPYMASYGLLCGAVILSESWLLTAGHCGEKFGYAYTGSTFLSRAKNVSIQKHITHPKYHEANKRYDLDYDLQLLKLKKPLTFSRVRKSIKIIGSEKKIIVGNKAWVIGWGDTSENGDMSDHLQAVAVKIKDHDQCKQIYDGIYVDYISDNMLCAGYSKGEMDACTGDSGGPLVYQKELIGIVSFGKGCARPNSPGVYAKITPEVKRWIFRHIST